MTVELTPEELAEVALLEEHFEGYRKFPVMHYDRDGDPMTMPEYYAVWGRRFRDRSDYHRIASTYLPDGRWISTVWLGADHGYGYGPPLIFETMIFSPDGDPLECDRCGSEKWARWTHRYFEGYYRARPYWRGILRELVAGWRDAMQREATQRPS